jgi:hypothetical protein
MTANERLFEAGLLDQWASAVHVRSRSRMLQILANVALGEQAEAITDRVLAHPSSYGL